MANGSNGPREDTHPTTKESGNAANATQTSGDGGKASQSPDDTQDTLEEAVSRIDRPVVNGRSARETLTKPPRENWGSVNKQEQGPVVREKPNHAPSMWAGRLRPSTQRTPRTATYQQGEM